MTTYILAGGCDRQYPDYWKRLSEVILREVSDPVILSCMFSHEEEKRQSRYEQFGELFHSVFGESTTVICAQEDTFYSQIEQSDVLYLHGGRTDLLLDNIPDIARFTSAIDGKIVVGSSAGANFLAKACFSPSKGSVIVSSGILDIGVVVHYGVEQFENKEYSIDAWHNAAKKVAKLLNKDDSLVLLPEGNFTVIR